ncbi:Cytochrome c-553 precursor [Aliarcobacter thereius]|uniref:Cytochrome C n=2 Tax=Aliarcobacter thereius TaxID=544718 RepID=A0A1C0B5H9_9BACT|nr:c-type cytochrome [Aliarcobacter thereius]OCL87109.1 Cytochrome c-553 precursor [Aliarcobacter thereius]OCL91292.1 Cytochrome c-553 precursor [Aliarcobacter thereius]OCL95872.1 Cytochrome c-553 precursor [Aliarcobacter thereius LMG 24486]OCL98163.1 Cytochrome c-553 precursor [Aliarcobacter thereius]QBF16155.1 periplasmic monoheme cytochrome c553 [Aliarcobacter thereius LMG 24486]
MKKIVLSCTILAASFAFANPYASCVVCHGANGEKVALGKSKIIKDMSKEDFIASLKGYQDGTYGGPMKAMMTGQVKGMSEATMKELADLIVK